MLVYSVAAQYFLMGILVECQFIFGSTNLVKFSVTIFIKVDYILGLVVKRGSVSKFMKLFSCV